MHGRKTSLLVVVVLVLSGTATGMAALRNQTRGDDTASLTGSWVEGHPFRDRLMDRLMDIGHLSALSAAIVQNGETTWAEGYGLYDRDNGKEAGTNTIYLVASISKSITATAIMQLYEQGLLSLDADVNEYLPFSLRNPHHPHEPITVRMLLSHQSSLAADPSALWGTGMPCIPGDVSTSGYPMPFLEDYLTPDGIQYRPEVWTTAAPGEEMHYANMGYAALGYIVERLSNMSLEAYCQQYVFAPLDMPNSSFFFSAVDAGATAIPYMYENGYHSLLHYNVLHYPAGGLRTTVRDLSHFLIAHMQGGVYDGERILDEPTVTLMHTVQATGAYPFDYGLGFIIWNNGTSIGHTGGLFGVVTNMEFRPAETTGIILFTNAGPFTVRQVLVWSFIEQLLWGKAAGDMRELRVGAVAAAFYRNRHLLDRRCDASLSSMALAADIAVLMVQAFP